MGREVSWAAQSRGILVGARGVGGGGRRWFVFGENEVGGGHGNDWARGSIRIRSDLVGEGG